MAVTLAQAKLTSQDHLDQAVIDEFRKSSWLMDNMVFDDCVAPAGGGSTMTYAYTRVITEAGAAFRAVNSEYTASEATKKRYNTDLKIFGGAYEIDRIVADVSNEVTFQMEQKIKSASALFNQTVIIGDSSNDANSFDGLDVAVTGSSTEYIPGTSIDLSTSSDITTNADLFIDTLEDFLSGLDGLPSFLGGNRTLMNKIKAIARRKGMYQARLNEFGQNVESYNGIPLVDFGDRSGSANPVVPIASGVTSLYAARIGLNGFHGVSLAGRPVVKQWLPNFDEAGAVKKGEVEMVAAVALKATKAAGVLRGIKVQ